MIYIVLGMHKSGTTLVSQILHHSGISMDDEIDESVSYDKGNKYERQSALRVNQGLLAEIDVWDFWERTPSEMDPDSIYRPRIREIIQNAGEGDWGIKDPRCAVTYPLWAEELPEHKIIFIYREMSEVWPRYRYNSLLYFPYNFKLAWAHVEQWYIYNAAILATLEKTTVEYITLDFQELMTSKSEFERLGRFVGRKLDDRRKPGLHRTKRQNSIHLRSAEKKLKKKYGITCREYLELLKRFRERMV